MSKKAKDKKDKKGKKLSKVVEFKEVLPEVERTFYELEIEAIKKKILRLRSHIQNLDVANKAVSQEIHNIQVEKKDEAGALTHEVDDLHDNILKLRSENVKLTENYNNEKQRSEETIGDLEVKYKKMHDQLCADIKRINGKLNACEEFRLNRDNWLIKFNERADEISEKEAEAQELFRKMEAKSVYERELLKDELLGKLTLAGEEFTGAGAANSSDLNLRLIRENIALQKNIDMLVNSNNEMDKRMETETALYQANKEGIPLLEQRNRMLIRDSQDKLNAIERISEKVQRLKQEYIDNLSYRGQNISVKEFQMCARFRRKKFKKLVSHVGQQINTMECDCNLYEFLIEQYKRERENIEKHLEHLRLLVERMLGLNNVPLRKIQNLDEQQSPSSRGHLLNLLVGLLQVDFDLLDTTGRRASLATLKPYEKLTRFDQLFKQEAPSLASLMDLCVAYIDSDAREHEIVAPDSSILTIAMKSLAAAETKDYETILPVGRPLGRNYIFDVESGTSLYYSSELEDPELADAEAQQGGGGDGDAEEEGEDSSDDGPKPASADETPAAAKSDAGATSAATVAASAAPPSEVSATSKLPPGTIVDVLSGDEGEEQTEVQTDVGDTYVEDEEYDINLFY